MNPSFLSKVSFRPLCEGNKVFKSSLFGRTGYFAKKFSTYVSSGLFHFALTLEQVTDTVSTTVVALTQASIQLEDGWGPLTVIPCSSSLYVSGSTLCHGFS